MSDSNGVTLSAVERLAQRRAANAAADRATAEAKAETEALAELDNLDTIDRLRAQFPGIELHRVDTVKGMAIIRTPTQEQFRQFQRAGAAAGDDPDKAKLANQVLAEAGTVHPSFEVLEQWEKDGFRIVYKVLAARVIELCGSDTTVKKL